MYALEAGGYDESMDRYGTTGQLPACQCVRVTPVHSSDINMYFSDFVTCISLILQTIFLRFLKTVISHIMTWTGMAPGPAGAGTSES